MTRHAPYPTIAHLNEESRRSYREHMARAQRRTPELYSSRAYRAGVIQRLLAVQNGEPWVDPR